MKPFAGTWALVRLALRRDRIVLPIWIIVLGGLPTAFASSFSRLYPTVQDRLQYASGIASNPATTALYGHVFDPESVGGLTALRIGAIGATVVGLMNILTVIKHTRAEEESGRRELLGAGVVGRHAGLAAALVVAALADLLIGVLAIAGLAKNGLPVSGAVAVGAGLTAAGLMFAAVAAVAAQLTVSARAANGIGVGVLALAFVLRAAGDAAGSNGASFLHWLSPTGWVQQLRPFADERWWVLLLAVAFVAVLLPVSFLLADRRDLGAGVLADRPGPAEAGAGLHSPVALAWRLQRGSLLGWSVAFALIGLVVGSAAKDVGNLVGGSQQVRDAVLRMGGQQSIVEAFLAALLSLMGLGAAAYGVQAVLRLRSEETGQRVESLLSTSVTRQRWTMSHVLFGIVGTAVPLLAAGLGIGLAHGLRSGDLGGQLPRILAGALVQLPAAWVLAGVAVALFGLLPRFVAVAWGVLAVALLLGQFGPTLKLNQATMDVSPFTHTPKIPGATFTALPLVVLVVVAAVFVGIGLTGFRRRDVG